MRKAIPLLGAVLALAACGSGGGDVVATVDGAPLTVADVRAFPNEAPATIDQATFAQYLGALIQWQIVDAAAADEFGIDPTDEEVSAELETVLATEANGMTLEEVQEAQNLSEATIRRIVRIRLIQRQVQERLAADAAEPTSEELAETREAEVRGLTEVCARHLLVATAEEAETARERILAGEDFVAVASEVSIDPSVADNEGDLGCALAQRYVPEFRDAAATAEIDVVSEPVETQFGFHLILVYDRTEPVEADIPTDEEVRALLQERAGATALEGWLEEKVTGAQVEVEEEYGTWTLEPQPQVIPPSS